jgi:hypothetical protein
MLKAFRVSRLSEKICQFCISVLLGLFRNKRYLA